MHNISRRAVLPFFDARVVSLYGKFERGLYRGLERT
jgi:hypothetical protein